MHRVPVRRLRNSQAGVSFANKYASRYNSAFPLRLDEEDATRPVSNLHTSSTSQTPAPQFVEEVAPGKDAYAIHHPSCRFHCDQQAVGEQMFVAKRPQSLQVPGTNLRPEIERWMARMW